MIWVATCSDLSRPSGGLGGTTNIRESHSARAFRIVEDIRDLGEGISATAEAVKRLDEAGWLPHVTTPLSALATAEVSALSRAIAQHYRDNWDDVKRTFMIGSSAFLKRARRRHSMRQAAPRLRMD